MAVGVVIGTFECLTCMEETVEDGGKSKSFGLEDESTEDELDNVVLGFRGWL
jgi:hypothetical protein